MTVYVDQYPEWLGDMTQNRNLKRRVRAYMAEHNVPYTQALREIQQPEPKEGPTEGTGVSQNTPGGQK